MATIGENWNEHESDDKVLMILAFVIGFIMAMGFGLGFLIAWFMFA